MTRAAAGWASSTPVHVAVAAVAMGAWAAVANAALGPGVMVRAALVQAMLSGAITLGLKRTLETLGAALPGTIAVAAPPLVTCTATLALLVGAHTLARTPHLWRTIALPYAVSSTYAWTYSLALARRRAARRDSLA